MDILFLHSLREAGLIEITILHENIFINQDRLPELEKLVRLHYEMGINPEGIETICHLLQRMNAMQEEIRVLKNRLGMYEKIDW